MQGKAPSQSTLVETRQPDHQESADPAIGAPPMHAESLDDLRTAIRRLEATEARLRRRARMLSEHLLAAERRNAELLPAEEEIRRLRDEVRRLTDERTALTADVARVTAERSAAAAECAALHATLRQRDAMIDEVLGSRSWALTAPLRALVGRLLWRTRR